MNSLEISNKKFWSFSAEKTLNLLEAEKNGLSEKEATKRLEIFGPNSLPENKRFTKFSILLSQFKSPLIFILFIAGIVTVFLKEYNDSLVIFSAVVINSFLGFYQENKAENALLSLKTYLKEKTLVLRGEKEIEKDTSSLVPGDIIKIYSGNRIPADAKIISENNLLVDEAIITGESLPVKKSSKPDNSRAILSERSSIVLSGTLVVDGFGTAVIISTGAKTELGRIASLVKNFEKEETPLQKSVKEFTIKLGIIIVAITSVLFGMGIYFGQDVFEMFITSVAVAVSTIPEGLPIALTVILAVGVERIAKKKGIVRKLLASETLGSATIILTDKTGTLTEAETKLSKVISFSNKISDKRKLITTAILSSDVVIEELENRLIGRPLETSLVREARRFKISFSKVHQDNQILDKIPFNSKRKFSAVMFSNQKNKKSFIGFFGAPDILLKESNLSPKKKLLILEKINNLAYSGEKVLGVSLKEVKNSHLLINKKNPTKNSEFIGLISFRDPVRKNVKSSIKKALSLGVKTVIVTGDHVGTAESVAKEIGFIFKKEMVLTGSEMEKMNIDKLRKILPDIKIFARVTPEQKLLIAKMYKELGEVVAMTGDGVNDAPALKEADIGVVVGSGTEVAKGASDLIILDNNFQTIVSAIEEGRKTLSNIKKVIVYLLSDVVDELFLIGGALLTGLAIPLNALQILWVNFFSDSFPAIGLAFENRSEESKGKPSHLSKDLLDEEMKFLILIMGISTSFLLFVIYYSLIKLGFELVLVRSFIFASFALYSLILAFALRSLKTSIFQYNFFSNSYLTSGVGFGFFLMGLAIYYPPLQNLLGTVALPPLWVLGVLSICFFNILSVEFGKYLYRNK